MLIEIEECINVIIFNERIRFKGLSVYNTVTNAPSVEDLEGHAGMSYTHNLIQINLFDTTIAMASEMELITEELSVESEEFYMNHPIIEKKNWWTST